MPYIGAGIQRFNTADELTVTGTSELKNNVTVTGDVTASGTVLPTGDTAAGDAAALGFTSAEGLILTGQGSTSDVVIKNDADATVLSVPTGTTGVTFAGAITGNAGATLSSSSSGEFNALTISQADNSSGNESRISFKRTTDAGSDREVAAIVADRVGGNDTALVFETNTDGSDGATERVRIDHDGHVGIGTASGSGQVTIEGDGSTRQLVITDDDVERLQLYHIGNDSTIESSSSGSNSTNLIFKTSSSGTEAERFRIKNDGDVSIADGNLIIGTSGHGIDFSATSDASGATSELLDDYEEGTWTPVLLTSSGTAATYGAQQIGKYVKIGDLVHIYFDIAIDQINNSNTTLVVGHPFNSVNNDALAVSFFSTLAVSPVFVSFQCAGSQGFMAVGLTTAGTNITNGMGVFGNSARIIASGTYRTA